MTVAETPFFIPLRLSDEAHYYAKKFAAEQDTPEKAKRVYLNTLAVCAVHSYLQWMEFETDITQGDCWNPVVRRFHDVADLVLPNLGKLECRPVLPGATVISLPVEVREDRLGYVAVGFEEQLDRVKLLGFVPLVGADNPSGTIPIARLESFDSLIECLEELEANPAVAPPDRVLVDLSQWLQGVFQAGWQSVEALLGGPEPEPALAFRSRSEGEEDFTDAVKRGRLIDLGMDLAGHSIALVAALLPESSEKINIRLRVYPMDGETYLPEGLTLTLLDESGEPISDEETGTPWQVRAREVDNWIQWPLYGEPGDRFWVKISLGDASVTEEFVI